MLVLLYLSYAYLALNRLKIQNLAKAVWLNTAHYLFKKLFKYASINSSRLYAFSCVPGDPVPGGDSIMRLYAINGRYQRPLFYSL